MVSYVKFSEPLRSKKVLISAVIVGVIVIAVVAASLTIFLTTGKKTEKTTAITDKINKTAIFESIANRIQLSMDRSANPCTDFYQYACGGWLSKHPVPYGKTEISTVTKLQEKLYTIQRSILQNSSIERSMLDSDAKYNVFKLFRSCMDVSAKEKLGMKPIKDLVAKLGGFATTFLYAGKKDEVNQLLQKVMKEGSVSPLFDFDVSADMKHSNINILQFQPLGSALFEKIKYETVTPLQFQFLYVKLIKALLVKVSDTMTPYQSNDIAKELYDFEIMLLRMTRKTKSSSKYYKTKLAKMSIYTPTIDWVPFINTVFNDAEIKVTSKQDIILLNTYYFEELEQLLQSTSTKTIHNYMVLKVVMKYLDELPEDIISLLDELTTLLRGNVKKPPKWQTCVAATDSHMGLALGAMFVQKVFSEKGHVEANNMVTRLRKAFKEILPSLSWIDYETRAAAKEKVDAIVQQIGYPPYILDSKKLDAKYERIKLSDTDYFYNIQYLNRYKLVENFKKLDEPVNRNTWLQTPATINAYYNPRSNHIVFPAGILQPPFFETDYPKAVNYGCIGSVIGHEMTHGFDNTGRWFDKNGNLREASDSWWSYTSVMNFKSRSQCFIDQYSFVEVADKYIDGEKTLGENIADNGGINIAYKAYKDWVKENGEEPLLRDVAKTNDQLFFLSFAQFFCSKKTEKALENQLNTDVHSPNMERVRGTIQNAPEFSKAFNCPKRSKMNPDNKCKLW